MEQDKDQMFVIATSGDGAGAKIVTGSCLKQAVHAALCTCLNPPSDCESTGVPELIASLDDDDSWTHPYPSGKRNHWGHAFEDGGIDVFVLSNPDELGRLPVKKFEQIFSRDIKPGDSIAYDQHGGTDTVLEIRLNKEDDEISILYKGTVEKRQEMSRRPVDRNDCWWGPVSGEDLALREVR